MSCCSLCTYYSTCRLKPQVSNCSKFWEKICAIFLKLLLDKNVKVWYNKKIRPRLGVSRPPNRMSQYPNWLHFPMHLRKHSVALLSRPNVHDLGECVSAISYLVGFISEDLSFSSTSFL